jgi:hypothetical protein
VKFGVKDLAVRISLDPVHAAPGWEWEVQVAGDRRYDGIATTRPDAVDRIVRTIEEVVRKP